MNRPDISKHFWGNNHLFFFLPVTRYNPILGILILSLLHLLYVADSGCLNTVWWGTNLQEVFIHL